MPLPSDNPVVTLPRRVAGKARTQSAYATRTMESGQTVRRDDQSPANQSIQSLRFATTSASLVRDLVDKNGLASTALINLLSLADSGYQLYAYKTWTQEFSREGLLAAETILSALDTNWSYDKGYTDRRSLDLLIETALWEVGLTGGVGAELVLDSYRLPRDLVIFPYDQVVWKSNGKGGRYPAQKPPSMEEVELNYPTVFIAESVKSATRKYAVPFMASGVQRLLQYEDFIEDMWRVVRRAGEPRLVAKLSYDKVLASAPPEVQSDATQLSTYLDSMRSTIEGLLNGLAPEDALVIYDVVEVDQLSSAGEKKDFKELLNELSGQAATALKSNASMLGMRLGGSQNVASTEAMLSTKIAQRLQKPVAEVMSRALTLAVRLYGVDAYVEFRFKPINLRPEEELEAHKTMQQSRVFQLLSAGRITDDEAQVMLGLGSLPEEAAALSGTWFYETKAPNTLPASGTNARNANVMPETPSSGGGADNEQRP